MGWHPWHLGENFLFIGFKKTFQNLVGVKDLDFFVKSQHLFILVTLAAAFFFGRFTVFEFANVFAAENQCSLLLKSEMMTMQNPDFSVRPDQEISN